MTAKTIKINDEEFPESILNAPKIKFLRPKNEPNFRLLLEEEDLLSNKKILDENFQKNTVNEHEAHSKYVKRTVLEYIKRVQFYSLNESSSYSSFDSGEL